MPLSLALAFCYFAARYGCEVLR